MGLRRLPRAKVIVAGVVAVALVAAGIALAVTLTRPAPPTIRNVHIPVVDGPSGNQRVVLDASFFTPAGDGRVPAVLLAHGFGGTKDAVRPEAENLARAGFVVLTWSARGFGASTGQIGLNSPDYEVKDVEQLVSWLARQPQVLLDHPGDPRVGITGASYGGGISLLAGAYDHRIDAVVAQSTWNNLATALFPNSAGGGPDNGVFKRQWAGLLFTHRSLGEEQACPLPFEHAVVWPPASAVGEQRGGQVVPCALGDDGVDPVVIGAGQERDSPAVGSPCDPDPRIARMVQQHLRLAGEPADELLDVLHLVVGRVQPNLPGRGTEPPRGPGQYDEAGPRQVLGLRADGVLGPPESMRQQHGRHPAVPRRREEAGVEHNPLVSRRPVHHGDVHVADGRRRGPGQRDREGNARCHQCDGHDPRDDDLRSRKPAQTHARTLAITAACSEPTEPRPGRRGGRRHLGAGPGFHDHDLAVALAPHQPHDHVSQDRLG